MASLFDSGNPSISITLDVPFPSNVISAAGVKVDKTNSVWTVGLDLVSLTENTNIATPSGYYSVVWDTALARYEKVRLDNLNVGAVALDFRVPIGDVNYAVLLTDRYIGLTATLGAIRTITLPAASTVPAGRQVTLQDEVGGVSSSFYHSIVPTGADTINGLAVWQQKTKRGGVVLRSNGSNAWNVIAYTGRSPVADAAYVATSGDQLIAYTTLTVSRIVTLPAANAYPVGQQLVIIDESGSCSASVTISLARAGADLINGAATAIVNQAFGYIALESDGVSKWTIVDNSSPTSAQISDSTVAGRAILTSASVPAQRILLGIDSRTTVDNSGNFSILVGARYVVTTATFTAPRTATLPAASSCNIGQEIAFEDEFGGVSATNTWTIAAFGADTLNGGINFVLNRAFQGISLRTDGVSKWAFADPAGPIDGTPIGAVTPSTVAATTLAASGATALTSTLAVTGQVTFNTAPASFLNQGIFQRVSATAVSFTPKNGSMIKINGNQYLIPSAGIAGGTALFAGASTFVGGVASQNLAATTFYYVYAFINAGVVTFDFSTTTHATSATAGNIGVEIKSGDDTRTLVGAVYTNASAITDADATRTVISWFSRQPKRLQNAFTATRSTAATNYVELNSEIRCNFIIWADDVLKISFNGFLINSGTNVTLCGIGIDGTTPGITHGVNSTNAANGMTFGFSEVRTGISEGAVHYATAVAEVNGGTGSWQKVGGNSPESFSTISGYITG